MCRSRLVCYHEGKKYQYTQPLPAPKYRHHPTAVKGTKLTCPKHDWAFDAKSGDCIKKGNTGLTHIEAKVVRAV